MNCKLNKMRTKIDKKIYKWKDYIFKIIGGNYEKNLFNFNINNSQSTSII